MKKIHFLVSVGVVTLLVGFYGCSTPTQTTSTTSSTTGTLSTQTTTQTSLTTNETARDIEIDFELVGPATHGLVGIGKIDAVGTSKEIVVTGNIFSGRDGVFHVIMIAEFYDSSGTLIGTAKREFTMYAFDEVEYREYEIKFTENPSQVVKCKFIVSASE
jgi:hypothetical protein